MLQSADTEDSFHKHKIFQKGEKNDHNSYFVFDCLRSKSQWMSCYYRNNNIIMNRRTALRASITGH